MSMDKFQEGAESFQKTMNDSMKWFQETTKMAADAYLKQVESASAIVNSSLNKGFGVLGKEMTEKATKLMSEMKEITRKNLDSVASISKTTLENFTKFSKQKGPEAFSKENMSELFESYVKEAKTIEEFNKKFADSIQGQFTETTNQGQEVTAKLKKDFEKSFQSTQESFNTFRESFTKQTDTQGKSALEAFTGLNKELTSMVNQNMKLWSDFMNQAAEKAPTVIKAINGTVKKEKTTI
jgi:hypothetical protein